MKMKNQKIFLKIGALIVLLIFLMVSSGCVSEEKIGRDEAIRKALNDPRTIQAINNSAFNVSEVGTASLGISMEPPKEVYSILINVLDGSNRKINVLVTYDGKVALVDIPYPMITPPHYPANNTK
jgi:hypothetical protein